MTKEQKIVLLIAAFLIAVMLLYPPYEIIGYKGERRAVGYDWIFDLPTYGRFAARVNISLLIAQWLGVIIITGIFSYLLRGNNVVRFNRTSQSASSEVKQENVVENGREQSESMEAEDNGSNVLPSRQYLGVGGWLKFLVIYMTVLAPILLLGSMREFWLVEQEYPQALSDSAWLSLKTKYWSARVFSSVLLFAYGIRLWIERNRSVVDEAVIVLWLAGPATVLFLWFTVLGGESQDFRTLATDDMIRSLIGTTIHATLWTLYLKRSSRVKQTYVVTGKDDRQSAGFSRQDSVDRESDAISKKAIIDDSEMVDGVERQYKRRNWRFVVVICGLFLIILIWLPEFNDERVGGESSSVGSRSMELGPENISADEKFRLGYRYHTGEGIEKDLEKAVYWYRLAAEQGSVSAQYNLGVMYELGIGVVKSLQNAKALYEHAASNGSTEARKALEEMINKE